MPTRKSEDGNWEITEDGLYIATREFLIQRGYCCGNRCRNCPYVNWQLREDWQPLSASHVQPSRHVSSRSIAGAQALLHYHEESIGSCTELDQREHARMLEHYRLLLQCWRGSKPTIHAEER